MNRRKIALDLIIFMLSALCLPLLPSSPASGLGKKADLDNAVAKMADELRRAVSEANIKRIGISEFSAASGNPIKLGPYLSDKLTALLVQGGAVEVIERAKLDVILSEQRFGQTGMVDGKSAQEVGRLLGIQAFIMGSYTVLDKSIEVTARLVDAGTGKAIFASPIKIEKIAEIKSLLEPLIPPTPLQLEASVIVQRKTDRGYDAVLLKEGETLYTNDNIKVFFRTNQDCYVYVLLFGSSGEASRIFPNQQVNMSNRVEAKKDYYIPPGDDWFWLDDKIGTETIYVIAGYEPLRDIDKLLVEMEQAGSDKVEASRKVEQSLNAQTRGIGGVRPGQPVTFVTADGKKIERVSEVVEGKMKAVRKISFQHE